MSDENVFYDTPRSRARIVPWRIEEAGASCRRVTLDFGPPMRMPEYLAISPMGKIPAILRRGQGVAGCAAICACLADAFPEAGLAPAPAGRASGCRGPFFAAGPLEAAVTNLAPGVEAAKEKRGFVGHGGRLGLALDALETALTNDDVAGSDFSPADVHVGSQIRWGMIFGTTPERPAFAACWERLKDRPARARMEAAA